jgi:recombination protein U
MDARRQVQNMQNNAQGQIFEAMIKTACVIYIQQNRAEIEKVPEPFRVIRKHANGEFTGRFTAKAAPDFSGTLDGGKAIHFEAKYTTTDQLKRAVLTDEQMRSLERHTQRGAITGVCAGIQDHYFFVPWTVWRDMKLHYGRQYVTAADLERYRVRFNGAVLFLDYANEGERA